MKKAVFFTIFISAQVTFVFLQIHQYSQMIKVSYKKQKNEKLKSSLAQRKQELTHQLYALHNKSGIKEFAINELKLEPINLNQIKKLSDSTHDNKTV